MIEHLLQDHYKELLELLDCLKVGVYITDGEGKTLLVNDESCKTGGLTKAEVVGRYMEDLEKEGFIEESVTLKTLKSGKVENMIQNCGDGNKVFVSAQPVFADHRIAFVITTERDITEIVLLKELMERIDTERERYLQELEYLRDINNSAMESVIASDESSKKCVDYAIRLAGLDTNVLLNGESGTGKEIYANLIYRKSDRYEKPFIKVNIAAIPETLVESELFGYEKGSFTGADKRGKIGYFELANNGTIFLDEIGEMPINLQSKLLRVIQEKEVMRIGGTAPIPLDVRIIAATNIDLRQAIAAGKFREDLYYRLAVTPIDILPLRKRKADIRSFALYYIKIFNKKYSMTKRLTEGALRMLEDYDWPGNVRELQNIVERAVITFDVFEIGALQIAELLRPSGEGIRSKPPSADIREADAQRKPLKELLADYEKKILIDALLHCKTATEAGRLLDVEKSTLSRRMKRYGIKLRS
jgi:PAS domain S-box-containing protein